MPKSSLWVSILGFVAGVFILVPANPLRAGCNEWTTNGPWGGGVTVMAADPTRPSVLYVGVGGEKGGGVYKSTDGGATWAARNEGIWEPHLRSLAVNPLAPDTLYAAGVGIGVFRSMDGAETWQESGAGLPAYPYCSVNAFTVDPRGNDTVYAAVLPLSGDMSVYKSLDGGTTWFSSSDGLPVETYIYSLAFAPGDSSKLYAGTSSGLFLSPDGGLSWAELRGDLPGSFAAMWIAFVPEALFVAGYEQNSASYSIFKSLDEGATWQRADSGLAGRDVSCIVADPECPGPLYAGTEKGLLRSTDGGDSWQDITGDLPTSWIRAVLLEPGNPSTVYACPWSGVYKSTDAGATWANSSRGIATLGVHEVAADPFRPGHLFASTDGEGMQRSLDGGASWARIPGLREAYAGAVAFHPRESGTIFVSTMDGLVRSTDGGESWAVFSKFILAYILIDRADPRTMYALSGAEVRRSADGGATWAKANTGLEGLFTVSLAMDPNNPSTLYAGSTNDNPFDPVNRVFKSTNGGATWTPCGGFPAPACDSCYVWALAVDPFSPLTVYAGTWLSGVFRSDDGGATWEDMGGGLPSPLGVFSLAADPARPGVLYCGAAYLGGGAYRSEDRGRSWTPLSEGLSGAGVDVWRLALDPLDGRRLLAATEGGVYILDQVPAPGDCDEDGEVSIGEVQRAINMFVWGTTPACGVDADGNGQVTIGEVQKVINIFLGYEDWCEEGRILHGMERGHHDGAMDGKGMGLEGRLRGNRSGARSCLSGPDVGLGLAHRRGPAGVLDPRHL